MSKKSGHETNKINALFISGVTALKSFGVLRNLAEALVFHVIYFLSCEQKTLEQFFSFPADCSSLD